MSSTDQGQAAAAPAEQQQSLASQQNKNDELLACQWNGCGERCASPELLYDHICERHVGRKSTNNLNLTCCWGTCRTTTVKRDHITSHIRVHVPLKPHKCDFCGKSFKRPQDLKKHVKTHADDSVLLRSPDPAKRGPGFRVEDGKAVITDLQALAATATGYYENPLPSNGGPQYGHQGHNGNGGYYPTQQQTAGYGPVYYGANQGADMSQAASFDTRHRSLDLLNDFFGDAKRRQFDPHSYIEIGHRLAALQGIQIGVPALGYAQPAPMMMTAGNSHYSGGPIVQPQYALPQLPNIRTKTDLQNVDQILEQMQTTIYESPSHAATASVQPVSGLHPRNSPPYAATTSGNGGHVHATASPHDSMTPGLSPPSSSLSHTSGNSPDTMASAHSVSYTPRSSMGGGLYPNLPATSSATEMTDAYPATSGAPTSVLGNDFDNDPHRRFPGGVLQKASSKSQTRSSEDEMDTGSGSGSATPEIKATPQASVIDPALEALGSPNEKSTDGESDGQETWVENMRLIEQLRLVIREKLERKEYVHEDEDGDQDMEVGHEDEAKKPAFESAREKSDAETLYPVLRAMEEAN